ncbi:hypothetical protein [Marinobacter sp. AL4B]|uniref:hypothetical protein n=1 Tax=Marinobacter sp. AL4B TaxID=2871173 RepID=UPI001CAA5F41|nr:hypothetical protein [Marinobacter sp. AL4B]MBZ0334393.1 hypothetical protein [Marinobacter sp. AL4B]
MKGDHQVILFIIFCLAGFFLGINLSADFELTGLGDFVVSFTTLLAAFSGAWYAFHLQNKRDLQAEEIRRVEAANRAIFTLARKLGKVRNISKQFVSPFRADPLYFLAIPPIAGISNSSTTINYDEISFLFNSDDPNLMAELSNAEEAYNAMLDGFALRSEMHFKQLQPLAEKAGFEDYVEYSDEQIRTAIGVRLYNGMKSQTDALIESLDSLEESLLELSSRLTETAKSQFKGHTIIGVAKDT